MLKDKLRASITKLGDWSLPSLWATRHRIIDNKPMQFFSKKDPYCHRPWALAILDDMSREVVVKKARQMGVTEILGCVKMFWQASLAPMTIVYTLPKWGKAKEIADERIGVMGYSGSPKRFSEDMRSRLVDWETKLTKHVVPIYGGGRSVILIVSSWNEDIGESTAADSVFFDEYDRMRPGVISAFGESLSSSRFGLKHIFSTPTFPNQGVDGKYNQSTKNRYMYRCRGCGHWQYLTRNNVMQRSGPVSLIQRIESHDNVNILDGTFDIGCTKCNRTLKRMGSDVVARWVPETVIAEISGYSMSQLDCAHISADVIMRKFRDTKPGIGLAMNYIFGEAYLGEGIQLEKGFIYTLVDTSFPKITNRSELDASFPGSKVSLGIDWGKNSWYTVKAKVTGRNRPVTLAMGYVTDTGDTRSAAEESAMAMVHVAKIWGVDITIADFGYGKDRNPILWRSLAPKFFACDYGGQNNSFEPVFLNKSVTKSFPIVKIDRTSSLKDKLSSARHGLFCIAPMKEDILDMMDAHFRGIAVRTYEDETKQLKEEAIATDDDHLLHTHNYADIGLRWIETHQTFVGFVDVVGGGNSAVVETKINAEFTGIPTTQEVLDIYDLLI